MRGFREFTEMGGFRELSEMGSFRELLRLEVSENYQRLEVSEMYQRLEVSENYQSLEVYENYQKLQWYQNIVGYGEGAGMAGKTISEMVGKPLEMGGYQIIPENGARKTKDYKMEILNGKRFLQRGRKGRM